MKRPTCLQALYIMNDDKRESGKRRDSNNLIAGDPQLSDEEKAEIENYIAAHEKAARLAAISATVANAKETTLAKTSSARKSFKSPEQIAIDAHNAGPGREKRNEKDRNAYAEQKLADTGQTVRPYCDLSDKTMEERASHKRAQAAERQRNRRSKKAPK